MEILLLSEILDQYEAGTLDMTEMARKCYLSEKKSFLINLYGYIMMNLRIKCY